MFGYRRGATLNMLMLLCAMSFILYVDRVNLSTAAGPIMKELKLSNTELGVAFSAFAYSYAIFQICGGWLADRIGPRVTLSVCGAIWVVTTIATGFVTTFYALLAVRFLLGIGEGATLPAAGRALANWTPREKRGFAQGITHSFSRLGNAVTPPIVAALILAYSWRTSFVVIGVVSGLWVVVWTLYARNKPTDHPGITEAELAALRVESEGVRVNPPVPWGALIRRIFPTMLVYFCYGWTGWLFFTWLPTFFLHGYNLDIKSTAIFASAVFFAGVFGDTLGGVLSDVVLRRTGNVNSARRNVILLSFGGALICLLPTLVIKDLTTVTACLAGAFLFLELTIGPIWAVPIDVAPDHAGTASGFVNAGAAVAGILSPIAFGIIIDQTGNWTLPFAGSIVLLLLGMIATFFIRADRRVEDPARPTPIASAPAGSL